MIVLGSVAVHSVSAPSGGRSPNPALNSPNQAPTVDFEPPRYIPVGMQLSNTTVIRSPREFRILTYTGDAAGEARSLMVVYTQISSLDVGEAGLLSYFVIGDDAVSEEVLEEPAALVERRANGDLNLIRQNGRNLNHLLGNGLSLETLKLVAESIPEA